MTMLANLARWVRVRGLREGPMQIGRVEGLPNDARDDAQRPQDYGFAAQPVDGQGLKLEVGGHTIIIRMDRLAERPRLAEYEVCVWHKEGHRVTLRAGKLVEVSCDTLRVNAAVKVELNTPLVTTSAALRVGTTAAVAGNTTVGGTLAAVGDVTGVGKSLQSHTHGGVDAGPNNTSPPN